MRLLVSHIVVYQGCATFLTERPNAIKQIKLRATPSFHIGCPVLLVTGRDERIVDFCYLILSCFGKMISVSDPNPVLVETMLSVSENYPKVYCDAQHTFLCCVYFAS